MSIHLHLQPGRQQLNPLPSVFDQMQNIVKLREPTIPAKRPWWRKNWDVVTSQWVWIVRLRWRRKRRLRGREGWFSVVVHLINWWRGRRVIMACQRGEIVMEKNQEWAFVASHFTLGTSQMAVSTKVQIQLHHPVRRGHWVEPGAWRRPNLEFQMTRNRRCLGKR